MVRLSNKNNNYFLQGLNGDTTEIVLPEKYQYSLPTTVSDYLQSYTGEIINGKLQAKEISTTVGGYEKRVGVLEQGSNGVISLNGEEVTIREGKILNNHKFDQDSIKYFLGQQVRVEGSYIRNENGEEVFQIQTLIPHGLFSAEKENHIPQEVEDGFNNFKSPFKFLTEDFPLNKYAQGRAIF